MIAVPAAHPEGAPPSAGAPDALAAFIERYWHALGADEVRVWTVVEGGRVVIRSNLVNGLPPSWTGMRRAVDWEAVAGVLRDTLAPEVWERLVREHTTWKAA